MTDFELPDPRPEEASMRPGEGADPSPSPATAKERRSKWTMINRVVAISIAVLLAVAWLMLNKERPKVEAAIEANMIALRDQDASGAYALLSSRARTYNVKEDDIQAILQAHQLPYEEYQSTTVTSLEVGKAVANDPALPQGTFAEAQGEIAYSGGMTVPFIATLEKEAGEWRVFGITFGEPLNAPSPQP